MIYNLGMILQTATWRDLWFLVFGYVMGAVTIHQFGQMLRRDRDRQHRRWLDGARNQQVLMTDGFLKNHIGNVAGLGLPLPDEFREAGWEGKVDDDGNPYWVSP